MKAQLKICFFAILITGIIADTLIFTSDQSNTLVGGDSQPSIPIPRKVIRSPPSIRVSTLSEVNIFGNTDGADFNDANNDATNDATSEGVDNTDPSQGTPVYARFSEPPVRQAVERAAPKAYLQDLDNSVDNNDDDSELRSSRWIGVPPGWFHKKTIIYSPCFYNYCPNGLYTFVIKATCKFTVVLVDSNGVVVQTIGFGGPWKTYKFQFKAKCGQYRVKIILDCWCTCGQACYSLTQNQTDCFNCNNPLQFYNPKTCSCQCTSNCNCLKPQIMNNKTCSCQCPPHIPKVCPSGKYWDGKSCSCQCLPKCCKWRPIAIPTPCGC